MYAREVSGRCETSAVSITGALTAPLLRALFFGAPDHTPVTAALAERLAAGDVLLHRSNDASIEVLEPRGQTDYSGRPITAVFATADPVWPLFFATLDYSRYTGSVRNGCFETDRGRRHYFFSVNDSARWCDGAIYVLPRSTFTRARRRAVSFDEWWSPSAVEPVDVVRVTPGDFPFADRVAVHREGEWIFRSWLAYKRRQRRR